MRKTYEKEKRERKDESKYKKDAKGEEGL